MSSMLAFIPLQLSLNIHLPNRSSCYTVTGKVHIDLRNLFYDTQLRHSNSIGMVLLYTERFKNFPRQVLGQSAADRRVSWAEKERTADADERLSRPPARRGRHRVP